jgi:hypothetical protein
MQPPPRRPGAALQAARGLAASSAVALAAALAAVLGGCPAGPEPVNDDDASVAPPDDDDTGAGDDDDTSPGDDDDGSPTPEPEEIGIPEGAPVGTPGVLAGLYVQTTWADAPLRTPGAEVTLLAPVAERPVEESALFQAVRPSVEPPPDHPEKSRPYGEFDAVMKARVLPARDAIAQPPAHGGGR